MANRDVTPEEVKSIQNSLEVSPSKSQPTSKIYNPGAEPYAAKHGAKHKAGAGGTMTKSGTGFGSGRRSAAKNIPKHV